MSSVDTSLAFSSLGGGVSSSILAATEGGGGGEGLEVEDVVVVSVLEVELLNALLGALGLRKFI